ncbi:MAG: 50S ribosomal protein L9 [Bacteroidales bacterium]|nr:50S ribosomal protein L9 [Bacteroidales bacterium]
MEVILKQDVANLGHKDDIVVVKNGYGANYLIPQGMAIMATPSAKKVHQENLRQRAHKEAKIRQDAEALAAKIAGTTVKVAAKVSETGKVFGSVNNIQVAEALVALGHDVDRKNITLANDVIKEVGTYEAVVKIYRDIKAEFSVEVVAE